MVADRARPLQWFQRAEQARPLRRVRRPVLHGLPAETPLDAEVPASDVVLAWRHDADDPVVLDVQLQRASDAAVRTDGIREALPGLVPRARLSHVVLRLEHQRAGRTDAD